MPKLKKIKIGLLDEFDRADISRKRRIEIRKFQDPRRREIYESVQLSKEQEEQIDELYLANYGEKIPYTWHRHFTAFTGRFDPGYLPELLYIPEFEHYMNLDESYTNAFSDKNLLPILAAGGGISSPEVHLSSTCGVLRDGEGKELGRAQALSLLRDIGEVFIKPSVGTSSGQGCFVASFEGGRDARTGKTADETLAPLGDDFVVQKRLRCHASIAGIYGGSVNTFRVITYRWKDEVLHMPACMRIGQGGRYLDNAHAGGMFVGVSDDGSLGEKAFTEFRDVFTAHPDTGVVFRERRIELFPKVLQAAHRMSELLPQVGCVNWDFTIDETGTPILIEGNMRCGSVWLSEMPNGCGPFGDRTPEVLRWMRLMKKTPASQRKNHRFGRM